MSVGAPPNAPRPVPSRCGGIGLILMYHRVGMLCPDTHHLCVSDTDFREDMCYLRDHCHVMPLDELVAAALSGDIRPSSVAVTFDDGYASCLQTVSPILTELRILALFYVCTEMLEEPHEFWWDVLERIFYGSASVPVELDLFGDGCWVRPTSTPTERAATHWALVDMLYALRSSARIDIVRRVSRWAGSDLLPRDSHRPMVADEVRRLARSPGHMIGAHTIHHVSLPCQSPDAQRLEIEASKRRLEELTDAPVTSFSYPYGQCSPDLATLVEATGFSTAVSAEAGAVTDDANRFLLPRIEIKAGHAPSINGIIREYTSSSLR